METQTLNFRKVHFVTSAPDIRHLPGADDGVEVAFAGRSNAGKSSALNALCGRNALARVSKTPGRTQQLVYFGLPPHEGKYLVDLPGYGYAKVPRAMQDAWQGLIGSYVETRQTLKGVVVILDIRHEAKPQDGQILTWLREHNIPRLPVYTKIDKLSGSLREQHARALDAGHGIRPEERVLFSARSGQGRERLLTMLEHLLFAPSIPPF